MFRVAQKTEYALLAVLELAGRHGSGLVSAREISAAQGIPLRFLEQQLSTLHKAGLVESFRGVGGGCKLARDPSRIRVAEIVDAMEGRLYPMHCLEEADHTCAQDGRCDLQELWGDVHLAVRGVFERITLAELAERHRRVTAGSPLFALQDLVKPS